MKIKKIFPSHTQNYNSVPILESDNNTVHRLH